MPSPCWQTLPLRILIISRSYAWHWLWHWNREAGPGGGAWQKLLGRPVAGGEKDDNGTAYMNRPYLPVSQQRLAHPPQHTS